MKTKTAASPQHQSGCRVSTTSRRTRRLVPTSIGNVLITGKGLILTEKRSSPPEYNHLFRTILSFYQSSCWLLGDILLLGDRQWGNRHTASKYEEAMQATGLSRSTLRDMVQTCRRFPIGERHADLSFTHHQEIAKTTASPQQRQELLALAAGKKLSCAALRKELRQIRRLPAPQHEGMETCFPAFPDKAADPAATSRPDAFELLGLLERADPASPPLWDALKFAAWVEKQEPASYTAEQCRQALNLTSPMAGFCERVRTRMLELENQGDCPPF